MQMQTYEQRILIPDENKFLYNEKDGIVSDKVYLGVNANADDWKEISLKQKNEIENKLEEESRNV